MSRSDQPPEWACWCFTIPRQERLSDQTQVMKFLRALAKECGIPTRRIVKDVGAEGAVVWYLTDTRRNLEHIRDELLREFVDRNPSLSYQWPEVELRAPPTTEEIHYPVNVRRVLVEERGQVFYRWEVTA